MLLDNNNSNNNDNNNDNDKTTMRKTGVEEKEKEEEEWRMKNEEYDCEAYDSTVTVKFFFFPTMTTIRDNDRRQ